VALSRIRITALRCLEAAELDLDPRRNYIFGPNGAGKTSLLEAMFVLGRGRSFRTRQIRRLVQRGAEGFAVFGTVNGGAEGRVRRVGVSYAAGRLEKKIDGEAAAGMAELAAILPVHAIDPSVHALVEGGPSERRRFLDWGVFHVEPTYLDAWKRYRRALSQRNAALKGRGGDLRPWSVAVAEAGIAVEASRKLYVDALAPEVARFGEALLARPLALEYRRGWSNDLALLEALAVAEPRDRVTATTEVGPHRAELVLRLDERRVQDEASRGQQKLVAAALILAQVAVESAARPGRSVLVVDDPAAELDAWSLGRLLGAMADLPVQLVFTALAPEYLPPPPGFPVFHVEHGRVRAV
jgi:DNA replication and repair protein RecF